ncbi:MAG TPA: hypothetical protein G4O13_03910, partial [Dehalococcoidia bacterium]|nr:hypothetical protein [Dehalococcoidia bacterium]
MAGIIPDTAKYMKILLVKPDISPLISWGSAENIVEPLGLEYVAAGVASDHEVRILDLQLEKGLQKVLSDFHPDVVG